MDKKVSGQEQKSTILKFFSRSNKKDKAENHSLNKSSQSLDSTSFCLVDPISETISQDDQAFHHFIYDINISYHENQIDWVESNLLSVLEGKLHLRCFFSERDKKAGISFSEMTKIAIMNSKKTIICFSEDYVQSSWKQFEAQMVHYIDPIGQKRMLVPIVVERCQIPVKFQGLSMLYWPQSSAKETNKGLRQRFFWTKLLKSLNVQADVTDLIS